VTIKIRKRSRLPSLQCPFPGRPPGDPQLAPRCRTERVAIRGNDHLANRRQGKNRQLMAARPSRLSRRLCSGFNQGLNGSPAQARSAPAILELARTFHAAASSRRSLINMTRRCTLPDQPVPEGHGRHPHDDTPLRQHGRGRRRHDKYRRASVFNDRRAVLCGGGAVAFDALLASLLGGTRPIHAEGLTGPVPIVDRLAVPVVIDSYQSGALRQGGCGGGPALRLADR
jgi:hypothetical protein